MAGDLRPARLGPMDAVLIGAVGLRARPMRMVLAALGIAIGIAAMVAVVGISGSSRAHLDNELAKLGTNVLTVEPGSTVFGETAKLPAESVPMVGRIRPVYSVSATGRTQAAVYRNDHMPTGNTGGIAVLAVLPDLLDSIGGRVGGGAEGLVRRIFSMPANCSKLRNASRRATRSWLACQVLSCSGP